MKSMLLEIARMTSKGRVTIPKKVRDALHLQSGDKLQFICEEGGIITLRPVKISVDEVFVRLHVKGRTPMSTEVMGVSVERNFQKRLD